MRLHPFSGASVHVLTCAYDAAAIPGIAGTLLRAGHGSWKQQIVCTLKLSTAVGGASRPVTTYPTLNRFVSRIVEPSLALSPVLHSIRPAQ